MSRKSDGVHGGGNHAKKTPSKRQDPRLQDVWADNLEEEIARIQELIEEFQYVGLDTVLPGIVARPTGPFESYADYNYQTLRSNVDLTRALQVSFTLCDENGARPEGISMWRFNIAFDASKDLLAPVQNDGEIDFARHRDQGIDAAQFGEILMSSGMVLTEEVKWVVYCGTGSFSDRAEEKGRAAEPATTTFCGLYNFAHLLQFLTSQSLPEEMQGLKEAMDLFFPCRCDLSGFAQHIPGPALTTRDNTDPWRRPMFCNGQLVLEAFFRLPDDVRSIAFDSPPEPPAPEPSTDKHRRRHRDVASSTRPVNGVAKTGGG